MSGQVVVVGAVHEALPLLTRLLAERPEVVAAVVTLEPDLLARQSGAVDLTSPARAHDVEVVEVRNLNSAPPITRLRELAPDLIVVVGWTRLLGEHVLSIPTRGTVGFHASLLPDNRGRAPVNWALLRGEPYGGNTMMMLDTGTDTGDIVDQIKIDLGPDETCATAYEKVADAGAEMLVRNLDDLLAGTCTRTPQDPELGSENGRRTPEMGVIDWRRSDREIHDWIRAQTKPYPGAFGAINGRRVSLWASRVDAPEGALSPGEVRPEGEDLLIGCGTGSIRVTDWSVDGIERADLPDGTVLDAIDDRTRDWSLGLLEGELP